MRKSFILGAAMLLALAPAVPEMGQECGIGTAEAATIRTADRELRKNKDYEVTDIYERAHRIIYGRGGGKVSDDRVRIAVVINGDENYLVEDRVKNQIYSQLRKKFPRENFAVMKGTDVNTRLLQEAEDKYFEDRGTATISTTKAGKKMEGHDMGLLRAPINGIGELLFGGRNAGEGNSSVTFTKTENLDVDGVPVGMRPRGISDMRREDFVRAGRELGYDYVFVITLTNGEAENEMHNFILYNSITNHKNIWMRLRFVDVENNSYLYRNDIAAQGEGHNGRFNGKMLERSVAVAMREAMDDIAIDY